jgi:hypothetical protein
MATCFSGTNLTVLQSNVSFDVQRAKWQAASLKEALSRCFIFSAEYAVGKFLLCRFQSYSEETVHIEGELPNVNVYFCEIVFAVFVDDPTSPRNDSATEHYSVFELLILSVTSVSLQNSVSWLYLMVAE